MKTFLLALSLSLMVIASAVTVSVLSKTEITSGKKLSVASHSIASASQRGYELRCRGGGLRFNTSSGSTLPTGEQLMNMTVDFTAGTQAASSRDPKLQPGQCSWVDRGFRQGEPTQIRLEIVYFAQQKQKLKGSPVDTSATAAETYPDAQNVPQYLRDANRYWSFWVNNTNNGYMQATGHRHFKPIRVMPTDKIKVVPGGRTGGSNVNRRE